MWCRVTRHRRIFRGLTGCQRIPGIWGVTVILQVQQLFFSSPTTIFFQFYNFFFTQFYSININIFQTFIHTKNSFSITLSHLHSSFKFQFFQYSFSIQIPIFFITHSSFKFQFFHYSFSIQIPSFYYSFSIQIPISTKSWIQIKLI